MATVATDKEPGHPQGTGGSEGPWPPGHISLATVAAVVALYAGWESADQRIAP